MEPEARLLVTTDATAQGGAATVADALRGIGVTVVDVLEDLGTIIVSCPPARVADVSRVAGVQHVEAERSIRVPSPGSKVQ